MDVVDLVFDDRQHDQVADIFGRCVPTIAGNAKIPAECRDIGNKTLFRINRGPYYSLIIQQIRVESSLAERVLVCRMKN